jgi:hypothetical protein
MPLVGWWSTSWRRAFLVRTYSQKCPLVAARTHPSPAGWRRLSVLYCHTYWSSAQLLKRKYQSTPWRNDYGQRRSKHGPRSMSHIRQTTSSMRLGKALVSVPNYGDRYVPVSEVCYLCGKPLQAPTNKDHIPPLVTVEPLMPRSSVSLFRRCGKTRSYRVRCGFESAGVLNRTSREHQESRSRSDG